MAASEKGIGARRHVFLVGLPGAGKTSVGQALAADLDAPFVDIDLQIEEEARASVSSIFAERGEAAFRELERHAVARAVIRKASVVAPGGGWAAQVGNLERVAGKAFTVFLRTSPETAAVRTAGASDRPLLEERDREARLRGLLKEREPFYAGCDAAVLTDGKSVAEVAREVAALARSKGGW